MTNKLLLIFATLSISHSVFAAAQPELHSFRINATVSYRCYAGYDGNKVFDSLTKQRCDNKTYKSTLMEKVINIEIKDEEDPEKSSDLAGHWREGFDFKGRKFDISISLYKTQSPALYRVRVNTMDNEPTSRRTSVFTEDTKLMEMNPLSIDHSSIGTKEEISFLVTVQPATRK